MLMETAAVEGVGIVENVVDDVVVDETGVASTAMARDGSADIRAFHIGEGVFIPEVMEHIPLRLFYARVIARTLFF
jgi:hypothetical protein